MRRAIAPLILLLFWAAGCETEQDPVQLVRPPAPDLPLLLTDGFCLVSGNRVVLDRYDIDYYDFSAHLIYLNEAGAIEEKYQKPGTAWIYADSTKIYELSFVSQFASYIPQGPIIWYPPFMYPDYTVHIGSHWDFFGMEGVEPDPREDPRIAEALERCGQFRHGLQGEIRAVSYQAGEGVTLELELWNEDAVNYYYWDPAKLGIGRYHYVTNGLWLRDDNDQAYRNHVEPLSWDGADPDRFSLLESDSSVILTLVYEDFDELPPGTYEGFFEFPGPHYGVERGELEQEDGRLWLGDLNMNSIVTIE